MTSRLQHREHLLAVVDLLHEAVPGGADEAEQAEDQQDGEPAEELAAVPFPAELEPFAGQLVLHLGLTHPVRDADRLVGGGEELVEAACRVGGRRGVGHGASRGRCDGAGDLRTGHARRHCPSPPPTRGVAAGQSSPRMILPNRYRAPAISSVATTATHHERDDHQSTRRVPLAEPAPVAATATALAGRRAARGAVDEVGEPPAERPAGRVPGCASSPAGRRGGAVPEDEGLPAAGM